MNKNTLNKLAIAFLFILVAIAVVVTIYYQIKFPHGI